MDVRLQTALSDANVDATQAASQRQLAIRLSAVPSQVNQVVPLNLCLILDHSGSMAGQALETVKQAASQLIDRLSPRDRLSIIAFDHRAKVLVPNQALDDLGGIKLQINQLRAEGGTAIDAGLWLGMEELAKHQHDCVSQAFLLTDGENEHGDNDRCLKLAKLATEQSITINTLGFGDRWNQDVLEQLADAGGGTMTYIQYSEAAVGAFSRLLSRLQSVGLTNAHLCISLLSGTRLAALKPIAQVAPDTIELAVQQQGQQSVVRLGDLMVDIPRVVVANLYLSQLAPGQQAIAQIQVRYDDPAIGQADLRSEPSFVNANFLTAYQPAIDAQVQQSVLALAKYRQTQIAETKLQQGDRAGAATMLQTAAKTALQMGDQGAATVLQVNATRLEAGEELSEGDRKQTRIVSKTILQE
jgi:Ca-activated chloride channel family protein